MCIGPLSLAMTTAARSSSATSWRRFVAPVRSSAPGICARQRPVARPAGDDASAGRTARAAARPAPRNARPASAWSPSSCPAAARRTARRRPAAPHRRRSASRRREAELDRLAAAAERLGDARGSGRSRAAPTSRRHAVRVEQRRHLARVGEADADRRARLPRQPAAAEQALEVDDEVELPLAQLACEAEQSHRRRRAAPARAEAASLEADHLVELRVAVEQPRARRRHEPRDVRLRPAPAEQVQHRQRVHDVADRAGLDDQDRGGAGMGGRSASFGRLLRRRSLRRLLGFRLFLLQPRERRVALAQRERVGRRVLRVVLHRAEQPLDARADDPAGGGCRPCRPAPASGRPSSSSSTMKFVLLASRWAKPCARSSGASRPARRKSVSRAAGVIASRSAW